MIAIEEAKKEDSQLIYQFIKEIAEYEQLSHQVTNTPEQISQLFFGEQPKVFALMIRNNKQAIGYVIYFYNYSTFNGKYGLYLEDIYIQPEFRRQGVGEQVFHYLKDKAKRENLGRMDWVVLDWNESAQNFYKKMNAKHLKEWELMRLEEDQF